MAYQATIIRVFIASPGDVPQERESIRSVVADWNAVHGATRKIILEPVGWETHAVPRLGERPQSIINGQILHDADVLIGVFWTRLGTATGDYASGTVEEIEEHLKAKKPALIYFSNAPVRLDSVDEQQYSALKSFRSSLEQRGLIHPYDDLVQFRQKLANHLARLLNEAPFLEFSASDTSSPVESTFVPSETGGLSNEALTFIAAVCKGNGRAAMIRHLGGVHIEAGNEVLDTSTPRQRAAWQGVVEELQYEGYLAPIGHKGEMFEATDKAFKLCDVLGL